jgi:hypothetical protein
MHIPRAEAVKRATSPAHSDRRAWKAWQPMARRQAIEAALSAWRDAERRLARAVDGEADALTREVAVHRDEFQRLSAEHMVQWIEKLHEAESRRSHATPSTPPFHQAARDTQEIASEIWEAARSSDEDTPVTELNRRQTPRPVRPGSAELATGPGKPHIAGL